MQEHTFNVHRDMVGDKAYTDGDTRKLSAVDAAALVRSGALSPKGKEAEEAMAEILAGEPAQQTEIVQRVKDDAPNNKAQGNAPNNKAGGNAPANKGGSRRAAAPATPKPAPTPPGAKPGEGGSTDTGQAGGTGGEGGGDDTGGNGQDGGDAGGTDADSKAKAAAAAVKAPAAKPGKRR